VPCTSPALVPVNQPVSYRIPVVGTGYRFAAGHRLRLVLASDDQDPDFPAMMTFRHASVGTSSLNRVAATSRLLLPLAAGKL
jgi:predicted acyl esterase